MHIITKTKEDLALQFSQLQIDIKQAEKINSQPWKTNCSITLPHEIGPIDIHTAKQNKIESIVISLLEHRDYAQKAALILGTEFTGKYENDLYENWISDCKKRISIIKTQLKEIELVKLEKQIASSFSPEELNYLQLLVPSTYEKLKVA